MTENQTERTEIPAAAIGNIKEVLNDLEIDDIDEMYRFLSEWQILNSRLKIIEEDDASFNNAEMLYKLCYIQAMIHRIYPFARAETSHLTLQQINQDEMHNAFRVLYPHRLMLQRQHVEEEYLVVVRRRHN